MMMTIPEGPGGSMFVARLDSCCTICRHAVPVGVETCTTCLADYGLKMPGVA